MRAPRLRVPLMLEAAQRAPDGMGGYAMVWRALARHWAELHAGTAGERADEVGAQSVVAWRITVRAAPPGDPRRPRPGQRFRTGSDSRARCFRIEAVAEADPAGRWLLCLAKEEMLS
ncbi:MULTISPECIES: head-tail adaptor protein [unclassified Paracoccus (in: a-proteobacteria)]|uniref:head-tail adaptor protein n=1 Tax=unclassified Paracoccus (in: a-proteobacteria) TaxID=2688777 RepID=UPI0012B4025E|nr:MULTISPECIES: head-tail adaptor protein [unclassified Paracoccus (in: a-proteobacteria)]UXU74975.1 head-tail adaptor protein [Paracoccus sp. SMMA_5]UXU80878.1 head-tail adaptor protein [Paracoccus sp. SMMA_5_TC]